MPKLYTLTKSKLMAWRQCPRKLWLTVNRPELIEYDDSATARFEQGYAVGDVARQLYGDGPTLDISKGAEQAIEATRNLIAEGAERIYEAAFLHDGVLVLADLVERVNNRRPFRYRAVEVKSSTSVKDAHLDDTAIQSEVMAGAGLPPRSVTVAHIDNAFVYQGGGKYKGLLTEAPVDESIAELRPEVAGWIRKAKKVLAAGEPDIAIGKHCNDPYECPFSAHCTPQSQPEYPVSLLPWAGRLAQELLDEGYTDLRKVPKGRLIKDVHVRVWQATVSGKPFLDPAARDEIDAQKWPRYYLDFETIAFAIPRWIGTRPYQALPFQWSLHIEKAEGTTEHKAFLDTEGSGPMRACMTELIQAIGESGPVFVYSGYEGGVLRAMADFLPDLATPLLAIAGRLYDLLPLMRKHYYHPAQKGSWSIKQVLPTIAPELDYAALPVGDGNAAQVAYVEMIAPQTEAARCAELRQHLLDYCGQDTLAMVKLVHFISAPRGSAKGKR